LQKIKENKGLSFVEDLKKDLDGKTLIGEYIGNQNFQHLIKYSR